MNHNRIKPILFSIALLSFVFLYNVFGIFIETATGSFYIIILTIVSFTIIAFAVYSFVAIAVNKKYFYFVLIISSFIGIGMVFQQTFRDIGINMEYKLHLKDMQKIVKMFDEGKLKYDEFTMYVNLPKGYEHLSKSDGQVLLETRYKQFKIGFVITKTILRKQVVIIYSRTNDGLYYNDFGEQLQDPAKLADHWYVATAEVLK